MRFSGFALLAFCCVFTNNGIGLPAAVLLHEAGHIAAMLLFAAAPAEITVSALGCRMVANSSSRLSYPQSAAVSAAGPAANVLSFLIADLLGAETSSFATISLGMGILHFLPIEPLDGGQLLRAALSGPLGADRADKAAYIVSMLFLFPLGALGFLVLLRTRYNFSLLFLAVYLMLYLVLGRDMMSGRLQNPAG